jgi:ABC-type transport system involved in multi-copper enzyme maturation permease subunit
MGLILKDLIVLKKQGRVALFLVLFYTAFSLTTQNISMLGSMVAMICTMLPITSMSYDERSKWDKYALSLPIQRKTVVISKYVLGVTLNLAAALLVALLNLILLRFIQDADPGEMMLITLATCMAMILLLSVLLPIMFKFGVEKGRLIMFAVIFAPFMAAMLLSRLNIPMPDERMLKMFAYASPVIVICILLISVNISIGIYSKKEF